MTAALAVAIHGFVRATTDIDLLILAADVERASEAVRPGDSGYRPLR